METRNICVLIQMLVSAALVALLLSQAEGQSCGPRVSARLLAEIPCDMSKSSYCSAPGSAYPWSSVKRYINDNQGLVRRMYGDEKHSSVLLNEVDSLKHKFDQMRSYMNRGYSRTEYGRSARGSRRQPRPQLFDDEDDETPATIFRVVTETSIKVGDPVTRPSVKETPTASYKPATSYDSPTSEQTSYATTIDRITSSSLVDDKTTETDETTTELDKDTSMYTTTTTRTTATTRGPVTTELPTTPESQTTEQTTTTSTTEVIEELPVAMQRIGYEDIDDYDYEPGRKVNSAAMQNSVEEKAKLKQESFSVKKNDPVKYNEEESSVYEVHADDSVENTTENVSNAKEEDEEEAEVPRRGINACPVKNEVIAPYWANNTRGETLALLNVHPFEQYVHFEKCAFENHQMLCREGCRCEQQYRLHRLLAFDPKNECRGIFSDWFRFPSCCVCICYDLTPDIPKTRSRKGRMK